MEDKAEKRGGEDTKASLSSVPASVLHSRKPHPPSPTPSTSHKKPITPLAVTPLPSPVTSLKSEDRPKVENTLPQQSYSHPSTPAPQPLSPASALSPPPSPIQPKQESLEMPEKEELDLHKQVSAPFPSIYPGTYTEILRCPNAVSPLSMQLITFVSFPVTHGGLMELFLLACNTVLIRLENERCELWAVELDSSFCIYLWIFFF